MGYRVRRFICPDCDIVVLRQRRAGTVVRCTPCSIAYAAENARQLHARSGPMYERWRVANARAALRTLASTGPVEWPLVNLGHLDKSPSGGNPPEGFPFDLQFLPQVGV